MSSQRCHNGKTWNKQFWKQWLKSITSGLPPSASVKSFILKRKGEIQFWSKWRLPRSTWTFAKWNGACAFMFPKYQLNLSIWNHLNKLQRSFLHFQKRFYLINSGLIEIFLFSNYSKHEDPHTTFFCTPHDAGVVKDARFWMTSNKPPTAKSNQFLHRRRAADSVS